MKKQLFCLVTFLILIIPQGQAQTTFQRTYSQFNDGFGTFIQNTSDGGYIMTGGYSDVYVVKTDVEGNTVWSKVFDIYINGYSADDYAQCIQQTDDGGYIVTGYSLDAMGSINSNYYDIFLLKLDSVGNQQWLQIFTGIFDQMALYVEQTSDGGYIVSGNDRSLTGGDSMYLIKTDSNGSIIWNKIFGEGYVAKRVHQILNGGYVMIGYGFNPPSNNRDICVVKTTNTGDTLWMKYYNIADDWGTSILETSDKGLILCGYSQILDSNQIVTNSSVDLIKTDSTGVIIWAKQFSVLLFNKGFYVHQTTDGGFIITGSISDSSNSYVYLIKTNSLGNFLWSKKYGTFGQSEGNCVQLTTDGGYAILGTNKELSPAHNGMYFIKTDSLGGSGCNESSIISVESSPTVSIIRKPSAILQNGVTSSATMTNFSFMQTVIICQTSSNCSSMFNLYPDTTTLHHYFIINMANGVSPLSYLWSWGDYTYDNIAYPSHVYDTAGYYNICLTITDSLGCTSMYCDSSYLQKDGNTIISIDVVPSGSVRIKEINDLLNIFVFPNPFLSETTLKINRNFKNASLSIYNSFGQLVKSIKNINGQTIKLQRDNLPSGLYIIKLLQDNRIFNTSKLIITDN